MSHQIPQHRPSGLPPGWKEPSTTRTAYVAHRACGCFQGFAFLDSPQQIKDAARYVGMWIRDGHNVNRVALKEGEFIDTTLCSEHDKK
ncbi:hypothetical protein [Comamonas sp.]|uniref:hypothetical protein n=1 Tax=Comamonas sp. TaxID=34028 RepID=UPI00259129A4|nr:hypothetical protein [Comamonas sp.]